MENPELLMTVDELDEREWTYLGGVFDIDCEGGFGMIYCRDGLFAVFDKRESGIAFVRYLTRLDTLESIRSLRTSRLLS